MFPADASDRAFLRALNEHDVVMPDEPSRPLSELHPGKPVMVTILSHHPWGITAKIQGYDKVGASLDIIRRGSQPGVRRLAQDLPPAGTTIELLVGEVRIWHQDPGIWVDLTA